MIRGRVPLARRNLQRQRLRLGLSVAGVGLALLLVLALDAIYSGILRQVTVYPDKAGAPVMVSQRGVDTMHMSTSAIPQAVTERIRRDARVARAEAILYVTAVLGDRRTQAATYLIGYRGAGGPWTLAAGHMPPGPGEIILDEGTASRLGVKVRGRLRALGRDLRVGGLTSGTASVIASLAFVDIDTFRRAARTRSGASYLLVWPRRGLDPAALARDIQRDYPVTAQTRHQFSASERAIVSDMSTGLIRGMLVIGFVVGVAVAALSMYTATTSRLREYAVLKAIGMQNRRLYGLVSRQALLTVAGGLAAALLLLTAMAFGIPALDSSMRIVVTAAALVRITVITGVIAIIAALLPARRLAHIDPASVYRR
jgi:putative ABC transport system permease protein